MEEIRILSRESVGFDRWLSLISVMGDASEFVGGRMSGVIFCSDIAVVQRGSFARIFPQLVLDAELP